ncbi:Transmembrane protein 135 [Camellia lanceoleosa]|nr:Transmembrane protein 135 [Camellia lanceoleosa]
MSISTTSSFSSPPSPPQPNDTSDGTAERRLREAEDRLREAIEELQRRQRRARQCQPPCDHADDSCVANAIGNLCQSFLLSYGVRVGIGILLRAFKLARGQSYSSLLDLKQLVSEKDLIVREEACRIGLLFGGFTGSYHALRCLLRKLRKKETPLNARTLALYLLARLAQCAYNSAKSKNKFHLWGSHWRHGDFMDAPVRICWHAVRGAVRSTSFLSAFVGIFQGVICLHRKVASKDHKLVYWVAGGLAALSVLLEKKGRRGELALYVLPRAGDSLWYILVNRHLLPNIKNAEVALFCACMGGIMYYLEHEPDTMAPFLRSLIRRFLASRISNPAPSSNRSASYTYLQTLDAIKKPKLRENRDGETSASEKYNLESIPGL